MYRFNTYNRVDGSCLQFYLALLMISCPRLLRNSVGLLMIDSVGVIDSVSVVDLA